MVDTAAAAAAAAAKHKMHIKAKDINEPRVKENQTDASIGL